jgi:hypothetical protein
LNGSDVRIFYYIVAHKNPEQTARLVNYLAASGADQVCIHIDRKSLLRDYTDQVPRRDNVTWCDHRLNVRWSGFSQVECTLHGITRFLRSGCDYFVLLSGQDVPLKSREAFRNFLNSSASDSYIDLNEGSRWTQGFERCDYYYFIDLFRRGGANSNSLNKIKSKAEALLNKVQRMFPRRKLPEGLKLYGGSSWMVLHRSLAKTIVGIVEQRADITRFFRYTISPDEMFFHSIAGTFTDKGKISARSLTFAKFIHGRANPEILRVTDLVILRARDEFFARKFDQGADAEVISQLYRSLENGQTSNGTPKQS